MFEVTDDPVAVVRGEQQAEVVDLIEVSQNVVFDEFVSLVEKKGSSIFSDGYCNISDNNGIVY